jgi:hypothetical protein
LVVKSNAAAIIANGDEDAAVADARSEAQPPAFRRSSVNGIVDQVGPDLVQTCGVGVGAGSNWILLANPLEPLSTQ